MNIDIRQIHEGSVMEIRTPTAVGQVNFPPAFIADIQSEYRGGAACHVNYCGYQQCRSGHRAGPFKRTSWLLHVVLSGTGTYMFRGRRLKVCAGQVFLIFPGDTTTYIADREDPWAYCWVGCSGYRVPEVLRQIGFSEEAPVIAAKNAEALRGCIFRMMGAHRMTLADEYFRTAELLGFFGHLLEGEAAEDAAHIYSGETYAQVALRYLNDNYMYRIRISDLASLIGVERSYLARVFYAEYHQSPRQYLQRLRLEKACRMLEESVLSIREIADRLGYEDARSFTKMFRRNRGMSPTEYRNASKRET